jgi:hypothetical protein
MSAIEKAMFEAFLTAGEKFGSEVKGMSCWRAPTPPKAGDKVIRSTNRVHLGEGAPIKFGM